MAQASFPRLGHRAARCRFGQLTNDGAGKLPPTWSGSGGRTVPFDHNDHYHRLVLRQVPRDCARALDVGCGTGRFARRLAETGIEVDGMLTAAADSLRPADSLADRLPVRAPVMSPDLSLKRIRWQAGVLLPGCTIRRLLFWRYLLVFRNGEQLPG